MVRIDCRDIPSVDIMNSAPIQLACESINKSGYVILDHLISEEKVAALKAEFDANYSRYLHDKEFDENLRLSNRRYAVPIRIVGGFSDPLIYANPVIMSLVHQTLGHDAVLSSYSAIISLAGSKAQHIHGDCPQLFPGGISSLLPTFALAVVMPLIAMNDHHGTTAIWPGSHRWKGPKDGSPPEQPQIPVGSCMIWDFRLVHQGTPNKSNENRALIRCAYTRPWYQDSHNFSKRTLARLSFEDDFIDGLAEETRKLFGF